MNGIVLAGGVGSRLSPLTDAISKQLLPIYDKPMVIYPIATLMAAGIKDIAIITTKRDKILFEELLGSGEELGINFQFFVQDKPAGIAQAFQICESFIQASPCALILGDNIFHGSGLGRDLGKYQEIKGSQIFAYQVANPQDYGVVNFDSNGKLISIIEKPTSGNSKFAIPGLYFFDSSVTERSKNIKPSKRGELEITDVLNSYLDSGELEVSVLPRGTAWLDTGSFETLLDAANFVRVIEKRQGIRIASLEEISWRQGWITNMQLHELSLKRNLEYGGYLRDLIAHEA